MPVLTLIRLGFVKVDYSGGGSHSERTNPKLKLKLKICWGNFLYADVISFFCNNEISKNPKNWQK